MNEILWKDVPASIRTMYSYNKQKDIPKEVDKTWKQFDAESKEKKIILYGAGKGCGDFSDRYHMDYEIDCVIDNDVNKQGGYIEGYIIKSERYLDTLDKDSFCIIITTGLYLNEITKHLIEKGIDNIYSYAVMESKRLRYWGFRNLIKDYTVLDLENK